MRLKERFKEDETRKMLRGRFYDLVDPGVAAPLFNLCTLDHYYYKATKRGKIKRSVPEMKILQETLYNEVKAVKEKAFKKKTAKKKEELEEANLHTVSEAIERFSNEYLPTKSWSTQTNYNHALNYWDSKFGSLKLNELNDDDIQAARDALASTERSDATLNRYLAAFSSMISVCIEDWKWCGIYEIKDDGKKKKVGNMVNPCKTIKGKPEPDSRVRFLQPKESKDLLASCTPELHDAVMLSLFTGARKREIWELRFDAVNFEKQTISFWKTKNGKPRTVPIDQEGIDILKRRLDNRPDDNDWVFPSSSGNGRKGTKKFLDRPKSFEKAWDSAIEKSGIKNFRYHDLRHTAASYMVMSGATLSSVSEVLGHSDISQTYKYAHLAPTHLQGAIKLLSKEIIRITT